jgi:DNA-binding response OmpR family regulator
MPSNRPSAPGALANAAPDPGPRGKDGDREKKRILVVEDDEDISETLALVLSEHYLVDIAANGEEAADRLRAVAYDAIVLDLMMPVMDGAALKRHLDRQHIDVPVLLTSATADLAERAAELAIDDFLPKPFDLPVFERRLAALLARRAA